MDNYCTLDLSIAFKPYTFMSLNFLLKIRVNIEMH